MSISKSDIKVIKDWVEEIVRISVEDAENHESIQWFDTLSSCKREGTTLEPNWSVYHEQLENMNVLRKQVENLNYQFEEYLKSLVDEI